MLRQRHAVIDQLQGLQRGAAGGQRSGLVKGQDAQPSGLLQVEPSLDHDAATRCGGETAHQRHRCGDHQGTGAGDHQQHQRPVHPIQRCEAQQRRCEQGDRQGQDEHGWCVARREAIHEALNRRP